MKKLEKIAEGVNYSAANAGPFSELERYTFVIAPGMEVSGKVFFGAELGSTGLEMSFQNVPAGAGGEFLHTHGQNEEHYIVVKGKGEFQADGRNFPIGEGSVIRVSPKGKRTYRNTGNEPMTMICIQAKDRSLERGSISDGVMLQEEIVW